MKNILEDCLYIFKDDYEPNQYRLFIFKDFSCPIEELESILHSALNEIRQEIYQPSEILIIVPPNNIDIKFLKSRFTSPSIKIKLITYEEIEESVIKIGLKRIVKINKVMQEAPPRTKFRKPSGGESNFFIKTSLALSDYPYVCFIALAAYKKMIHFCREFSDIKTIYIDTSTIMPIVQAIIEFHFLIKNKKHVPKIVNFKSYRSKKGDFDFKGDGSFTFISASISGGLKRKKNIPSHKSITIFQSGQYEKHEVLYYLEDTNTQTRQASKTIPVTAEDFSLSYTKSKEVIIAKAMIEDLDKSQLISKILKLNFKKGEIKSKQLEGQPILSFDEKALFDIITQGDGKDDFLESAIERSLTKGWENFLIYDSDQIKNFIKNKNYLDISFSKSEQFLLDEKQFLDTEWSEKNIIVCMLQATREDLLIISRMLRKQKIKNITYIIGILIGSNFKDIKVIENNVIYNDTLFNYNFYSYLNIPLKGIDLDHLEQLEKEKLTNGFVFYSEDNASELNPILVYLTICVALELLRHSGKLSDDITHHNVISPENFHRFNDSLLQMSFVLASQGRELNFSSNVKSSCKMKEVILDIFKQNYSEQQEMPPIVSLLSECLEKKLIVLCEEDIAKIKDKYPDLISDANLFKI